MREELKMKLVAELLKNCRRSDRELARVLKTSQPTITRARQKIEREGYVRSYTFIPDCRKLGYEIIAFTFTKMRPEILTDAFIDKVRDYAMKFPNAIFATSGEGIGMTGLIVSLHKNYSDYSQKLALFRMDWGKYMEDIQSFVAVGGEGEIKPFSLDYLAKTVAS